MDAETSADDTIYVLELSGSSSFPSGLTRTAFPNSHFLVGCALGSCACLQRACIRARKLPMTEHRRALVSLSTAWSSSGNPCSLPYYLAPVLASTIFSCPPTWYGQILCFLLSVGLAAIGAAPTVTDFSLPTCRLWYATASLNLV